MTKKLLLVNSKVFLPDDFSGDISDALLALARSLRTEAFFKANPIVSSDRRMEIAQQFNKAFSSEAARGSLRLASSVNILTLEFERESKNDKDPVNFTVVDVAEVPLKKSNINKPIEG